MGSSKTKNQAKIDWLVKHPELLAGWPNNDRLLKIKMQGDGLVSTNTNLDYMSITNHVQEAKSILRKKK